MQYFLRMIIITAFIFVGFFSSANAVRSETISFAGVTHMVNSNGVWTNLGLGITVNPGDVSRAYVKNPNNVLIHEYSGNEFIDDGINKYYWITLPGPPQQGDYTFTLESIGSVLETAIDTQGELKTLPIIQAGDVTIEGNHTTTPMFSWPDDSPDNYYRLNLFDLAGNTLFMSDRSSSTTLKIPTGVLPVGIRYRARVEVHDSDSYSTLNNRANGENIDLDTILIPFAGVTNVNTPDGIKTHLDLGINVNPADVAKAYVTGPNNFKYEFDLNNNYLPSYNEYFISLDGSPDQGNYVFTLELADGSSQSVIDTQGPTETLPVISQYEIIGEDGVTPTFKWTEVYGRVLFYRIRIYDSDGNQIVSSQRLGGTAYNVTPGELHPNTIYQFRVEIHDSFSFAALNNRSNGEMFSFTTGDMPGPPSGDLTVIPVPWVGTAPLIPHDTYNGKEITFKAIARGGDGTYFYEWDFDGDGTYDFFDTTDNPYDLSARHTYPDQSFDRLFIARIRVTSNGQIITKEYPIMVHATATQSVKTNVAIDEALWWLHQNMVRWDSGQVPYGKLPHQALGATGAAVQAWENQGHKPDGNYDVNPYVEDVQRGMNFILSKSYPYPIHIEDSRDPDTLVNGYGIHSIHESQLYETGIVLMALASSGNKNLTCDVGGFGMFGRTYGDIAQDMVDFLSFAQNEPDTGVWRGGWRYAPNYDQSDMSVTQWPVIGLEAAESNFSTVVPQYVKDELEIYLDADQDQDGGFGYTSPGGNVARTGAGIACLAWIDAPASDQRVAAAINFINDNWNWDNMGNLYAMYAVMKGMRGFEPDLTMIGSHDWYDEYADFLIDNQISDGSWISNTWFDLELSSAAGVLILTPEVFLSPPVAVARAVPTEASPGTNITFDHSGSFHRDPERSLAAFRWDFDEDGIWDAETEDITTMFTWTYNDNIYCGEEVQHLAVLEVEDDMGNTDIDDETVVIRINMYNHPPVADGDPTDSYPNYYVTPGDSVVLDATQSFDPDEGQGDLIVSWEWDLNNDGIFDVNGETYDYLVPSDWSPGSLHTIALRVTDDGSWADECSGSEPSLTDEATITLAVGSGMDCANAEPSISKLWPPNHEMVEINILGIVDTQGNPAQITITGITQDEPVNELGDGDFLPDGAGLGTDTAQIRSERSGLGDGRVYNIRFVAQDVMGASCRGSVKVYVPHDKKDISVDDGQIYDSTVIP